MNISYLFNNFKAETRSSLITIDQSLNSFRRCRIKDFKNKPEKDCNLSVSDTIVQTSFTTTLKFIDLLEFQIEGYSFLNFISRNVNSPESLVEAVQSDIQDKVGLNYEIRLMLIKTLF